MPPLIDSKLMRLGKLMWVCLCVPLKSQVAIFSPVRNDSVKPQLKKNTPNLSDCHIFLYESRMHLRFFTDYVKLNDIRYLLTAKGRAIAIPVDLDNQVHNLFVKSNNIVQKTAMSWRLSARNAARRDSMVTASRDYRNIIERLQVPCVCVCGRVYVCVW